MDNINFTREGDRVHLSWPVPDWEGGSDRMAGFFVYRAVIDPEADCVDCPAQYTRVADVPLDETATFFEDKTGYTDNTEPGLTYNYQVTSYSEDGRESGPSETIVISR